MLAKIFEFVKAHKLDFVLFTAVVLLVLFSFACGFIIAKYQDKPQIQINTNSI
jgi:hypothetical protein